MTTPVEGPAALESRAGPPKRVVSLDRRLPVFIAGLIFITVAALLIATYGELERSALRAAHERLAGATTELAELADGSSRRSQAAIDNLAANNAVRRLVINPGSDSAAAIQVLGDFVDQPTQGLQVVGIDGRQRLAMGELPPDATALATELLRAGSESDGNAATVSLPIVRGDSIYASVIAPIRSFGQTRGALIYWSRLHTPPERQSQLEELIGPGTSIYFAAPGANILSDVTGRRISPLFSLTDTAREFTFKDATGREILGARGRLSAGPWTIVGTVPRDLVLAPTHALFQRLALAGAVLVLAGASLGWLISRRITRPLLQVTRAAGALASGDYSPRLRIQREDEIGRLGDAFDIMADRVEEAHARLESARADAESANLAKSRFLAMMSHEIRTPLNAIVGYTEFLKLGIGGPLPPQQKSYVDRMHGSAEHLLALVNDLLDMSSIEADRMRVSSHPTPLAATIREVCEVLESEAEKRGLQLSFRCDDGLWYRGDPSRVRQIVLNLVSNAIKFTDSGGAVSVICDRVSEAPASFNGARGNDWIVVNVRDTGIGISTDSLSAIWDPFVQVDASHTREHGGTGLGLTISRRLARLMGGEITVESEVRKGSVFSLWLPAAGAVTAAHSIGAA